MSTAVQSPRAREGGEFGAALAEGFARRIAALAVRLGAAPVAVKWARRAAFAVSRATGAGHVCVSLARLAQRYDDTAQSALAALRSSGVVSDGSEDAEALRPLVVDRDGRLYLARYYEDERRLARAVVGHASGLDADASALEERLARFFGPPDASEVDWQRAAAALALSSRLTVVSGGPGTGKTTTVVGMLACLLDAHPSLTIALAAPTGKAAQRMQEALLARASSLPEEIAARLPRSSQTLHRLLGLGQGMRARYGPDNPLPYDVLVVDEASMIDVSLAAQLFDALSPGTRLVLLGDKDQLAAVEAGAVFAELSASPRFSEAGIARIARATGTDGARVRASLPRAEHAADIGLDTSALDLLPDEDDAFPLFDELDLRGSLDDAWTWTGLDEPDVGYAGDGTSAEQDAVDLAEPEHPEGRTPFVQAAQPASRDDVPSTGGVPLVDCVVWLERNYRFGLDSPIGRLSLAIRRGDVDAALDTLGAAAPAEPDLFGEHEPHGRADLDGPAVLDEDAGVALASRTLDRLAQGFAPYAHALRTALAQPQPDCEPLFDALNAFRILCATRLGARGVDALNAQMAEHVRRSARAPLMIGTNWFAGRAVMVARNDYALGLFNGDIGIALPTREGPLRVYFRTADGGLRAVAPAALPPHDTAFALTVHKSQGSEFDHAALILPASKSRVLARELVYTAITRARKTVRIVGGRDVLAEAIATPTRRDSGLFARMQEAR
ncbi:exodeoxyribonuclease V subunit alpha [Trinickia dabaoshanensis]|uniref:RecBCD enzyme subunit RecD n=1 Tax=Trinickia dabaoshanensis TaxID=564714 RepID=A0A2N7VTJ0_9BURK|nr:AAA family ATPase [Trinickia dabaoshanensis]PMS20463.1 exodeoxyribonuclease V subunit alpha [Trinickia dabaoshanensis]